MAKQRESTVDTVTRLVQPYVEELGLELWDVRFEKEGSMWFLRIFADREGGISIDDCEALSRAIDEPLDKADPIAQSYVLEVSSPGIERELVKDWHFLRYIGYPVTVRFIRPRDGRRELVGELCGYEAGVATVAPDGEEPLQIAVADTAFIRLYEDYDAGGF